MRRLVPQALLILMLALFCAAGYYLGRTFLNLPFRATNDALHEKDSPLTLDFLIPGGTYIDEKMTIKEALRARFENEKTFFGRMLEGLSGLIPRPHVYVADLFLFLFWSFLYLVFVRTFTFVGYGRALRSSLLLGGVTYYFMPDFSPGKIDDLCIVGFALALILIRACAARRRGRRRVKG